MSCPATTAAYQMSVTGLILNFLECIVDLKRSDIADKPNRVKDTTPDNFKDSYDFIIMGAGAAG